MEDTIEVSRVQSDEEAMGAEAVEECLGAGAPELVLREARLVEDPNRGAHGAAGRHNEHCRTAKSGLSDKGGSLRGCAEAVDGVERAPAEGPAGCA